MSSRFYSYWFSSALAGLLLSLGGCGGGDTQVASAPAPAPSTPAPSNNPAPTESADASKAQVSYGSEAPSNSGSGNSGGANSGGNSGGMNSGGGRSMGAIGEATFDDGGGVNSGGANSGGSMMPNSGMMSGGPPALSGGPASHGVGGGGGVGGGNARGSRNPGTGAPMSGGNSGGSYGGESMSSGGPMGSGESFGMNNGPDLSMLTTFIQNNCAGCHANGSSKGGVSLDRVGPDLKQDANLWKSVLHSLEESTMPPRNSRQPDATRKAAVIELIRQALGGDAGEVAEPSFMERAEIAYRKGERENAMSLFYAALVTASDSEAAELADHFKFYKPTTKAENLTPANDHGIAVKNKLVTELPLAIGVLLKVQTGITDVKPVGVNQAGGAGGGGASGEGMAGPMAGGRGGGGAGGGAGGAMGKLDAFEDLTGEVGQAIVSAYSGRRSSGKFGTLFSSLTQDAPVSFEIGGAMNQGFSGGPGDASSEGGLASGMGMGGGGPAAPGRGMGGAPGRGMGGPGMGMGGPGMGMGGDPARPTKTLAGKSLANGLTYIGKADNVNALLKKAQEAGVDGLIIVEVEASKPNRMSPIVTNETRFRFMLPSGRVEGSSTKTITNTQVEMGKQDSEFIQKQVDAMFAKMDSVLNVIDLPQIPTLAAMKQLHAKIHAGADPLQILAEARMYQVKGIISTDQLETVYQVVLEGNDGIALAKGSEEDRKLVLTSYTEKL